MGDPQLLCFLIGQTTGCTGYRIQYYAEDLQFDTALATHYCGVASDWHLPPGQLLRLISAVRGRGSAAVCIALHLSLDWTGEEGLTISLVRHPLQVKSSLTFADKMPLPDVEIEIC